MLDETKINKREQISEIIIGAHFLTYIITVAVLIVHWPGSYSYTGFLGILFGFFVPAAAFVGLEYYIFKVKKENRYKVFLWWNISKLVILFILITFTITLSLQNFPFLAGMYLLPVVVAAITFGRLGGLILAGASSLSLFLIILLVPGGQEKFFSPVFLFSGILLLVAWFLSSVMKIEQNTSKELLDLLLEREKMAEVLRNNEESLLQIIKLLPVAVLVHVKGKIVYVNDAAAKLIKAPDSQYLVGQTLASLFGEQFHEQVNLRNFEGESGKIKQTDGDTIDVEFTSIPLNYKGEDAVQTILSNITERKRMEEELLKANRLESIAILAGGVAHDFNNFLAVILGNISLIKSYQDQNKISEKLNNIEQVVAQARELTRQLSVFSKGGTPVKKVTSLKTLIQDVVKITLRSSKVALECILPDDECFVEIDASQISQVFNNLVINALQAMPEGGAIKIIVENAVVGERENSYLPLKEGHYKKVSVVDEGAGIPEKYLQNIFDPYFTTKAKGTGLGLAIVYSIIQKHGGFIKVESEVGVGTTFEIYLPAISQE